VSELIAGTRNVFRESPIWATFFVLALLAGLSTFISRSIQQRRLSFSEYAKPNKDYLGLRDLALGFTPASVGLKLIDDPTAAYGVVMDWGHSSAVVTVTGFLSGDASIYFSSGGGILGGRGHESVRLAANAFVAEAQKRLPAMSRTTEFPLPSVRHAKFYVLTPSGVFTSYVRIEPIEPAFAALWAAGQRLFYEARTAKPEAAAAPTLDASDAAV
jgi:hypothetical protein